MKIVPAFLLVLSACATAPTKTPPPAAAATVAAAAEQPKLVCEWVQDIGSNVRRKVCVPASEVESEDGDQAESADTLRRMQERTTRVPAPTPGAR